MGTGDSGECDIASILLQARSSKASTIRQTFAFAYVSPYLEVKEVRGSHSHNSWDIPMSTAVFIQSFAMFWYGCSVKVARTVD